MTTKRFTITQDFEEHHRQIRDNGKIIMGCFVEAQAEPIVNLLNELHEKNQESQSRINDYDVALKTLQDLTERKLKENEQLKTQLNYIQNSITEHIKHQKTDLGQKALKEIIADYNEWMLGHKELEE